MTVIQGLLFLGIGDDDRFFKGGGNHRGSEGLIEDGCKQTSKLISAGPQNTASNPIQVRLLFLAFTLFSSLPNLVLCVGGRGD